MQFSRFKRFFFVLKGWFPFTWGGLLLLTGSIYALLMLGGKRQDFIMIVTGGVGVFLSLIGLLSTLVGGIVIRFRNRGLQTEARLSLVENIETPTSYVLPKPWWLPLAQCSWAWVLPRVSHRTENRKEWVTFHRRGEWTEILRVFYIEDPFGFTRVSFQAKHPCQIRVAPNVGKLSSTIMIQGFQSGGDFSHPEGEPIGDRIDIRNYSPGDPVRYILWKVYARTGQLVVRQPERAFQPANRLSAYLISHESDVASAGAAWYTIQNNLLGQDWRFGLDGSSEPLSEKDKALDEIIRSSSFKGVPSDGLLQFTQAVLSEGSQRLLIFAPPSEGPWVENVIAASRLLNVQVVLGIDGLSSTGSFSRMMRYVVQPKNESSGATPSKEDLDALLFRLHKSNIKTQIADRITGNVMSAEMYQRVAS